MTGEVPPQLIAAAREAGRHGHRRSEGARLRPLCRRRHHHAEPQRPGRGDRHAGAIREAAIVAAATALRQRHGFGAVLVTRGNDGMTLLDDDGARHFPAEAAEVYDVAGAGDTAVATLAAGVAARAGTAAWRCGWRTSRPASWSGRSARRWRARADLLAALSPQGGALRKIVSRDAAAEHVQRWHHKGWRVGFTPGCFDLLQPGDLQRLEQAREACDRLVVGLKSPLADATQPKRRAPACWRAWPASTWSRCTASPSPAP